MAILLSQSPQCWDDRCVAPPRPRHYSNTHSRLPHSSHPISRIRKSRHREVTALCGLGGLVRQPQAELRVAAQALYAPLEAHTISAPILQLVLFRCRCPCPLSAPFRLSRPWTVASPRCAACCFRQRATQGWRWTGGVARTVTPLGCPSHDFRSSPAPFTLGVRKPPPALPSPA